jgi:hypothetical protein
VIAALATPDGTCELRIPKDRYDPLAALAIVKEWEREDPEPDPLWWRVAILEPGGRPRCPPRPEETAAPGTAPE